MSQHAEDQLVEDIYAAALDPTRWPGVLEAVADHVGALQACLTRLSHIDSSGEGIEARIDPASVQAFHAYYRTKNVFTLVDDLDAWSRGWRPTVVTTEDCLPLDAYYRSEYFNDFMRPQDAGATMHIRLELDDTTSGAIALGRSIRKGAFETEALEAAGRLQPHLIRAYKLGRLLAVAPGVSTDLARALEGTSQAVLIVDGDASVRHVNTAGERLMRSRPGLTIVGGRLSAQASDAARRLTELIGRATSADGGRQGGALNLPRPGQRFPLAVRISPLAGEPDPVFGRPRMVMVCVTDLERDVSPPHDALRTLFGLTQAEARLAAAVFDGLSLPEAADQFAVSVHTVRFQLARIFDKTGVARQAELVKLMMRLATDIPGG